MRSLTLSRLKALESYRGDVSEMVCLFVEIPTDGAKGFTGCQGAFCFDVYLNEGETQEELKERARSKAKSVYRQSKHNKFNYTIFFGIDTVPITGGNN